MKSATRATIVSCHSSTSSSTPSSMTLTHTPTSSTAKNSFQPPSVRICPRFLRPTVATTASYVHSLSLSFPLILLSDRPRTFASTLPQQSMLLVCQSFVVTGSPDSCHFYEILLQFTFLENSSIFSKVHAAVKDFEYLHSSA